MSHERPHQSFGEFLKAEHAEIFDDMKKEGMGSGSNASLTDWADRNNLNDQALQALSEIR